MALHEIEFGSCSLWCWFFLFYIPVASFVCSIFMFHGRRLEIGMFRALSLSVYMVYWLRVCIFLSAFFSTLVIRENNNNTYQLEVRYVHIILWMRSTLLFRFLFLFLFFTSCCSWALELLLLLLLLSTRFVYSYALILSSLLHLISFCFALQLMHCASECSILLHPFETLFELQVSWLQWFEYFSLWYCSSK